MFEYIILYIIFDYTRLAFLTKKNNVDNYKLPIVKNEI